MAPSINFFSGWLLITTFMAQLQFSCATVLQLEARHKHSKCAVTGALSILTNAPAPASTFCSRYLHIKDKTVTLKDILTRDDTTVTILTTITLIGEPEKRTAMPEGIIRKRSDQLDADLKKYPRKTIASACSCLSLQPNTVTKTKYTKTIEGELTSVTIPITTTVFL